MPKQISRLVPQKKHVMRTSKKTGETHEAEITYYIKPKEAKKIKQKKTSEVESKPVLREPVRKELPESKKLELTSKDKLRRSELDSVQSYDDFTKLGVDPDAARMFFCRL